MKVACREDLFLQTIFDNVKCLSLSIVYISLDSAKKIHILTKEYLVDTTANVFDVGKEN